MLHNELSKRISTAVTLAVIAAVLVWISPSFTQEMVIYAAVIGGVYESIALVSARVISHFVFMLVLFYLFPVFVFYMVCFAWGLIILLELNKVLAFNRTPDEAVFAPLQALILVGALFAHEMPFWVFLGTVVAVVSVDTFGYLVGKFFGTYGPVAAISPNKTWQGYLGGALGGSIVAFLFGFTPLAAISLVVLAIIGDLWISYLKRYSGAKDTGCILPGHGGILDRVDSWLPCLFLMTFI